MYGWVGNILEVDLSSGRVEKRPLERSLGIKYIGGRGINSRVLYDGVKPGTDPFGPENLLIFGTGPLGGTLAPASNRISVTAKAFYNGLGTSNAGGSFAPELKWAGYDHIIFRGKAEKPVYLWIDDGHIEIRPAQHIWGKTTWETEHMIKEELGDPNIKVASIGPAGESLVVFAAITFTLYRSAAQTGMGAVMGSKNLKALAVRGTKSIRVARPEALKKLTYDLIERIKKNITYPLMSVHGTPTLAAVYNEKPALGIRNYQQAGSWEGFEAIRHETLFPYYTRDKACLGCPIHCSHFFHVKDGPFAGEKGGGIEAGIVLPFGPFLGNTHTTSIFKCLNLCNQYGVDTMELAYALGAAMEWYEKGIITKKDTEGIALEWGNYEAIIQMIHKVGRREGLGDLLALGVYPAAQKLGKEAEKCVSYCKEMTIGVDDIRLAKGVTLNHATAIIPCHHEEGIPSSEGFPMEVEEAIMRFGSKDVLDPLSYNNKALCVIYYQNICTVMDALEICKLASDWTAQEVGFKEGAALFSAATGIDMGAEELEKAGDRIHDLERAFWVREGISRKDDYLQGKIIEEPVPNGPFKGERIDPEKFEKMLDEYYELRGWDKKTGIPTREKLEKGDLKDVADELEKMGKLPKEAMAVG